MISYQTSETRLPQESLRTVSVLQVLRLKEPSNAKYNLKENRKESEIVLRNPNGILKLKYFS